MRISIDDFRERYCGDCPIRPRKGFSRMKAGCIDKTCWFCPICGQNECGYIKHDEAECEQRVNCAEISAKGPSNTIIIPSEDERLSTGFSMLSDDEEEQP